MTEAVATDLPQLLTLKDACIARMRADGIEQWDEVYPDAAVLARDLAAGTLHVLREGDGILGYRRTGTATMRKGPFTCSEKLL